MRPTPSGDLLDPVSPLKGTPESSPLTEPPTSLESPLNARGDVLALPGQREARGSACTSVSASVAIRLMPRTPRSSRDFDAGIYQLESVSLTLAPELQHS